MGEPVVTPSDIGLYLSDPDIDVERAQRFIDRAVDAIHRVINPIPDWAAYIVEQVAGRGYATVLSPDQARAAAAGSPYGGTALGGVWVTADERAVLEGGNGSSEGVSPDAFTINTSADWGSSPFTSDYGSYPGRF